MNIKFRLAQLSDAEDLLNIYAPYVKNTDITYEYEVPSIDEFRRRMENVLSKFPYIVAIVDDKIAGYVYASTFRQRVVYNWGLETSIYIMEQIQGNHLGEKLYKILEAILQKQNITNLYASITYPNPQSIMFHTKMGYKKIAHFTKCGYKAGKWLDMIFMEKMINKHCIPARKIIYLPDMPKSEIDEILDMYSSKNR